MEDEVQEVRDLVLQLWRTMDRICLGCTTSPVGSSGASSGPAGHAPSPDITATATVQLVVIPRHCKRPMFTGMRGMDIAKWVGEGQAFVCACHLSIANQALFIFNHLGGRVKEEEETLNLNNSKKPKLFPG